MSLSFTHGKSSWPRRRRAIARPDFDRLELVAGHLTHRFSCRTQIGQPFQVPTHTFEFQLQPVGFMAIIKLSSYPICALVVVCMLVRRLIQMPSFTTFAEVSLCIFYRREYGQDFLCKLCLNLNTQKIIKT
jgi:hypothetical protein